ncbi:MAG: sigma-70 family RNA polymerase sigma factor [Pyrinomonadaceae bacterium]|nr:sigma-70 family RNA polymerase sigma factor [Pyrinomonadaceae bacterium]
MSDKLSPDITQLLQEWSDGRREALDAIVPLVYDELRRQAHHYLRRERQEHTLQTTALVNEAYLKLVEQKRVVWQNRAHFFAISASLMRRILVDYAKTKHRVKRGGEAENLPLEEAFYVVTDENNVDLLALDKALNELAEMDEQQAKIVELRYFSGLSIEETAEALHISPATVKRDWQMAKAWLHHQLSR